MSEQDNAPQQANADPDNTEEQMNKDLDLTNLDTNEDINDLRNQVRTAHGQKKHWREKHNKLSEDPRLKEKVEAKKPEPKKKKKVKDDEFDRDAFKQEIVSETITRQKYPNMTDEEINRAKTLAKAEGKSLSEMVEDSYFQAYLKDNEEKRTAERARPDSSNRSGNPSSGSVKDLDDPKKVKDMDMDTFKDLSNKAGKRSKFKITRNS